ncbi:hypothetical protein DBR17_00845 [Sphingomonas sp. HMWF008]|nr:hypothetical protein DBR17_00845 [Sphingomonas sp. HMWF008]
MADRKTRNRAPASARHAPATPSTPQWIIEEDEPPEPPLDLNTFDPAEFEWRPVPRRPRADGWTPDVQRSFIQALAETGLVEQAARAVDMSVQSAYRLRNAPESGGFARAWQAALASAAQRVLDLAFTRAIEGDEIPLFDRDGCRVGARWKVDNRMAMFILRAYMPDRFRHAHENVVQPGERPAPPLPPVAEAVAALTPPTPSAPHLLTEPERMENLILGARGRAEVYELYPPDDRERYRVPRREEDHPRATARASARRRRAFARPLGPGDVRITPDRGVERGAGDDDEPG